MMKRYVSAVLAGVMLLLAAGCGSKNAPQTDAEAPATILSEVTGIPGNKTVLTVGETEIPAEFYFYWLSYSCSSLEYYILTNYDSSGLNSDCVNQEDGSIKWDASYMGIPLMDLVRAQAEDIVKFYVTVEETAREHGADLTDDDRKALEENYQTAAAEMGGEEAFAQYLASMGVGRETFDRISAANYLQDNLKKQILTSGSDLYLSDEKCAEMASYMDHILIANQDPDTGAALSDEEAAEKKKLAEELLEQIRTAEDPTARFKELAEEYSEDPGRAQNPDGYVYTPNSLVSEVEEAAAALKPGEISNLVESQFGYHIILRQDLLAAMAEDASLKDEIADSYLTDILTEKRDSLELTYDSCMDSVDWAQFYPAYIAAVEALNAENDSAEPDAAGTETGSDTKAAS